MKNKKRSFIFSWIAMTACLGNFATAQTEAQSTVKLLLAPPVIKTAPGFSAALLVPPGTLYDPTFVFQHEGNVWLTDDGGQAGATGSRIVSVSLSGKVSVIVPLTRTTPMISADIAPAGFGKFGGQIIALSQAKTTIGGTIAGHIIQRLDPAKNYAPSIICKLPNAGELGNGIPGAGVQGGFGPPSTPFANRFFSATALNGLIYQTDGAGNCKPFADFSKFGIATGFAFTRDGKEMLVTTQATSGNTMAGQKAGGGKILRVSPDGNIDPQPVAAGLDSPVGVDIAPDHFGAFGGEIFVTDSGPKLQTSVPLTQRLSANGNIYRITPDGQKHLVASGFINPAGLKFINGRLWITDINGDYIGAKRVLKDGFIVLIDAK